MQLQDDRIASIQATADQTHLETHASIQHMEAVIAVYEQKITQLNQLEQRVDREVTERVG